MKSGYFYFMKSIKQQLYVTECHYYLYLTYFYMVVLCRFGGLIVFSDHGWGAEVGIRGGGRCEEAGFTFGWGCWLGL